MFRQQQFLPLSGTAGAEKSERSAVGYGRAVVLTGELCCQFIVCRNLHVHTQLWNRLGLNFRSMCVMQHTVNSRDEIAEQVSDFGKHTVVVPVVLISDHTSVDAGLADRWTNLQSTDCVAHHPQSVLFIVRLYSCTGTLYSYGTVYSSTLTTHQSSLTRTPPLTEPRFTVDCDHMGICGYDDLKYGST
eukprot:COSAG02_NODE_4886_length_4863_cov_9.058144_3_plen_188_part_00